MENGQKIPRLAAGVYYKKEKRPTPILGSLADEEQGEAVGVFDCPTPIIQLLLSAGRHNKDASRPSLSFDSSACPPPKTIPLP